MAGSAAADLGDTRTESARKYTPLPHDSTSDVVKDPNGKPTWIPDTWMYYHDGIYTIGQLYDANDIAVEVEYGRTALTARGDKEKLTNADVSYFLQRNHLSTAKGYWIRADLDRTENYVTWKSQDGKYELWFMFGDLNPYRNLYSMSIKYSGR